MVEWKKLGDLGSFENIGVDKKIVDGEQLVTLLNYVDVYHNKNIDSSIPQMQVSAPEKKIQACTVEQGDIFVTPTSETIDDIGHSSIITETIPHAVYSYHIMRYRLFEKNMLLSYYINYTFDTYNIKQQILKKAQGLTRFGLSKDKFASILIPIPSLSEQQRIVSILDTFTSSISNLKQQIEERRKQYEYERDLLLDLEGKEGVEMKKLGEMFSFKNGLNKGKEFFGKGKPIIMFTNVFNSRFITKAMIKSRVDISEQELERINAQIGDVFFTRTSETKEDVGYASVLVEDMEECTFAGFLIRARPITHKMLPQYCKYCFSTPKVRNAIVSKSSFTTRASLTGSGLGEVIIPLPPLSTQSRIVSILDTFEQSIANLEEQLAMREKQYEYYRNQLLTFE